MLKKYLKYIIRWQLSTPILWGVLEITTSMPAWVSTIIANLIGGLIFFWVDRRIFADSKNCSENQNLTHKTKNK